jgi:hypothetical protein
MVVRHLPFELIGNVLAKHDRSADTLSTSHMLDLSYESFAALRLPAALAAMTLLIVPVFSWLLRIRRRHYAASWTAALGMTLFLVAAHIALGRFGPYHSSRGLAQKIAAQEHPGASVMIYGDQAFGSSLLFYLHTPIKLVEGRTTSMWFGSTFPDAPQIYMTNADSCSKNGLGTIGYYFRAGSSGRRKSILSCPIASSWRSSRESS